MKDAAERKSQKRPLARSRLFIKNFSKLFVSKVFNSSLRKLPFDFEKQLEDARPA